MVQESNYKNIQLTLIIPVYNEEDGVTIAIEQNFKVLKKVLSKFEILIINDGSSDASQNIIGKYSENYLEINHFVKQKNEGLGSAVRKGVEIAKYEYILPVPVDCPLDEQMLVSFIYNIQDNEVVVGWRPKRVGYSLRMRINSYVFQKMIFLLFGVYFKDYNWIHLYKKSVFRDHGIRIESNGLVMLAEILVKASHKNLKMTEVVVPQKERLTGTATAAKIKTIFKTLKELLQLYRSKELY